MFLPSASSCVFTLYSELVFFVHEVTDYVGSGLLFFVKWKDDSPDSWASLSKVYARYVHARAQQASRAVQHPKKPKSCLDNSVCELMQSIEKISINYSSTNDGQVFSLGGKTRLVAHDCGWTAEDHTNVCFYLSASATVTSVGYTSALFFWGVIKNKGKNS